MCRISPEQMDKGACVSNCLTYIQQAAPYFICVIGSRYGTFIPEDEDIHNHWLSPHLQHAADNGFKFLTPADDAHSKALWHMSITELEVPLSHCVSLTVSLSLRLSHCLSLSLCAFISLCACISLCVRVYLPVCVYLTVRVYLTVCISHCVYISLYASLLFLTVPDSLLCPQVYMACGALENNDQGVWQWQTGKELQLDISRCQHAYFYFAREGLSSQLCVCVCSSFRSVLSVLCFSLYSLSLLCPFLFALSLAVLPICLLTLCLQGPEGRIETLVKEHGEEARKLVEWSEIGKAKLQGLKAKIVDCLGDGPDGRVRYFTTKVNIVGCLAFLSCLVALNKLNNQADDE